MYEHPYLAYQVNEYEQERIQQAAERRRFIAEHADQIVPRAAGPIRRAGQRMLRAITGARTATTDAAAPADRRAAGCEPVAAR